MFFKKKVKSEDIDLDTLDRGSAYRTFIGWQNVLLTIVLACFTTFQLYASLTNRVPQQQVRYIHLGFAIVLAFFLYPASSKIKGEARNNVQILDMIQGLGFLACIGYALYNFDGLQQRAGAFNQTDVIVGGIVVVLVLLACYRVVGPPIVLIASIFILYAHFGQYMPGFLRHRGYPVRRIITHLFYTTEGIIGTPIGVCSTFIFLFILFGAYLEASGIGAFFINISNALAGWASGGPAKVAVIASALEGSVSGSSVANTVGSGSITIPMMKSLGYKPEFAAAVEAAASTGGQLIPPIMGAAAFLIADALGVQFIVVIMGAIIPAALYFIGVGLTVHFEAKRMGLVGLPRSQLPKAGKLMMTQGHLLIPLLFIIIFLGNGFTVTRAALIGTLLCIFVPFLRKETRVPLKELCMAYVRAARNIVSVACACGVAGMVVGMVTLTGVGLKLGEGITALAGGQLLPTLIFSMFAALLLGMGVPTTANYLITSTIAAPILLKMGVNPLAAHMFCFYFGIAADITPPVALAAYAGSAIAKSDPLKTSVNAARLAIAAFIVPYVFVYNNEMLLIDPTFAGVAGSFISAVIGMIGVSSGLSRFFLDNSRWYESVALVAGGLLALTPGLVTDLTGIALMAAVIVIQFRRVKKKKASAAA